MRKLLFLALLLAIPAFGQVSHVAANCSRATAVTSGGANSWTFTCTPAATNNAIVFAIECLPSTGTPSSTSLTATGWTITAMSAVVGSLSSGFVATYAALAPNTSATTFTATFSGVANCTSFQASISDEFTSNDTTGGTTTFYAHNIATNTTGGCQAAASSSTSTNDMVWGFCADSLPNTNWQGTGWTKGVDDANGDGTEFKNATGSQTPAWASTTGAYVQATVVIKAASAPAVTLMPPRIM